MDIILFSKENMSDKLNTFYSKLHKMVEHLEIKANNRNVMNDPFPWMLEFVRRREELKQSWRELFPELREMKYIRLPPHRPRYIDVPKPHVIGLEAYREWYDSLSGTHHFY